MQLFTHIYQLKLIPPTGRIYDVITEMKLFLCFNLVYYIVQNLYTTLRVKNTIDVSIFFSFFSCNEVSGCLRDDIGMSSESILPPKNGFEVCLRILNYVNYK